MKPGLIISSLLVNFNTVFLLVLLPLFPSTFGQLRRENTPQYRANAQTSPDNITAILDTRLDGYDSRVRPGLGEKPLQINMTLYILNFVDLHDTQFLDGDASSNLFWSPDIFFTNEISSINHNFAKKNSFTKLNPNGESSKFRTNGYTASNIILGWAEGKETSVGVWYPVQNKDFIYLGHRISGKITTLSTGNYSRLIVDVGWKRDSTWHIWTLHVPLALISFISIIPLLGHFEHGPIMSIITTFASIFTGLSIYRQHFEGNHTFLRFYILLNWAFVSFTLFETIIISQILKNKETVENTSRDCKSRIRDAIFGLVSLGIFLLFNCIYWGSLCSQAPSGLDEIQNVDGDGWIYP